MNNFKKIGLTALAASLVSVSAHAGALTASGSASMNSEGKTGNGLNAGTTFSMANSVTFTGSGELDNGITASVSFELDQFEGNNSSNGFDNHSVTVSSDSLGTLTLAGHGGSSATSAIDTTAAGDMWDNFDALANSAGITFAAGAKGQGVDNNAFFYKSPDLIDGLNITASYNPQGGGQTNSEMGYGINYTGVEGLSFSYATTDIESGTASTSGDNTAYKASYAYGPVTVSYSDMEASVSAAANALDGTSTSYALSYTVSDELSVTYGSETHDQGSTTVDMEVEGVSVAYTSGGMTITGKMQSLDNGDFATGTNNDADYWALGASFAF
jgi:outer membrane protein OmpU